jgi:Flp pilus assembly protein TadD
MDLQSLLNEHRMFWKKIEPMFEGKELQSYVLRHIQSAMRIQASRLANDLGVLCLHKEAKEDARGAFSLALDMETNNLCAMVNQYTPEAVNLETKKGDPFNVLMKRITVAMGSTPSFDSFSDWEERYGTLYLNAVENLANLCNKVPDARNPDTCPPVMQQSRDYVRAAIHANSEPRVTPSSLKDETVDEEVIKIVAAIREGYSKAAETQVRTLLRKRRSSLFLWSLLAEALMNQGKFAEVQSMVLPEMRVIAETKGSEWIEMTAGCLAMRQGKPDYQMAHDQFVRVLQRKPDIEEAQNLLIQTALLLREPALIETDCLAVLAHSSRQPMANAVLGALRLNQDRLEDAEKAVRISIASRPSSPALNDLGETLRRMQRFQAAEGVTRRALLLQPGYYQAWDTLALILKDQGRLDEASEAHHAALRLCKDDIRLYLNAAKLEQARSDLKAVRQLLKESAPLLSNAAPVYKDMYKGLAKSMPL